MKSKKIIGMAAAIAIALSMCGGYAPQGSENYNVSVTASAASTLPAPKYVFHQCYGSEASAFLRWSEVEGAELYYIYRYDNAKKKYALVAKTEDNYYYAEALKPGKKYSYKIAAVKKSGGKTVIGNKSKTISFTAKNIEGKKVSVSKGCEFYDFKIRDLDGKASAVSSETAKKAVSLAKKSTYYSDSMIDIDSYIKSDDPEIKKYLNSAGKVEPKASKAYTYDYDGDDKKESFILVDMPFLAGPMPSVGTVLVYSDSNGEMTVLDRFFDNYDVQLIDFGDFKQLYIGGGTMGANENYGIYGERNGKAKCYVSGRCYISKSDCLLVISGPQGIGGTYYYDTVADEYRGIKGAPISYNKLRKMDSTGVLSDYDENCEFTVIGGRYYIYNGAFGGCVYVYKNGEFIYDENAARSLVGYLNNAKNYVEDIDLDYAIKNMIKVK